MIEYIGRIENDTELLERDNDIVIVGAGTIGASVLELLKRKEKRILFFCDNNKEIWGQKKEGIFITSVEETAQKYPDAIYLVCSKYVRELATQLQGLDLKRIHIIKY